MRNFNRVMRLISGVTLFFFVWSFLPAWQVAAYAAAPEARKNPGNSSEQGVRSSEPTTGERFEKAIENIRGQINKADEKHLKGQDITTEVSEVKKQRAEIEKTDSDLKKEFAATEKKLTDAKLPKEILDRHAKFVKHYEDNLAELKTNLSSIEKPSATSQERRAALAKAKAQLDRVKPPKKHIPLDPNNLPNRMVKGKERAPRLKKEEFEKDFPVQKKQKTKFTAENPRQIHSRTGFESAEKRLASWSRVAADFSLRKTVVQKPVLVASNGSLSGLLSSDNQLPSAAGIKHPLPVMGEGWGEGAIPSFNTLSAINYKPSAILLAQTAPVDAPTEDDLAETPDIKFTQELQQIATLLENNPVQLYEFVRNNFTYDPYYGSVKGSQGTILLQNGNDIDQASVLIALFRVSGIPARYAYGTVEIPIEKVMKWLGGITDPRTAATVLATNGIPSKLMVSGGEIKAVQLEHTWIEVYIPYANYRGLINDPTAAKTWIPLDPSFKFIEPNPDATDLAATQQFDIDSYLTTYLQTVKPTTPAKEYLKNSIDYVTANIPGKSFYDLLVSNTIADKMLGLLPDTLPYPVKSVGAKFSAIPDIYRHRIALEFTAPNTNETVLNYTASWTSVLHNRFTLSYTPATAADEQIIANYGDIYSTPSYLVQVKPVLKVEGITVAEGSAVGMAGDLICKMNFIGPTGTVDNVITNNLTVGATHAIGLGSGYTTGRIIKYRGEKLRTAAAAGQSGEPILGEYLNLMALDYLQELDSSRKLISKSMKLSDTNRMAELMVGVDLSVSYLFGMPKAADVNGALIDVDYNISTPVDMDGNQAKVRRYQILTGMTSSSLEHSVFESIMGVESVSTIKALQVATVQGITIRRVDSGNIGTELSMLQLTSAVKTDIQNAVNAGKVVTVSERNIQLNEWNGVGYIILDPNTGAGAYMISGGISGGSLTQKIKQGKELLAHGDFKTEQDVTNAILKLYGKIYFPMPVIGPIKSPFGMRATGPHTGVDIGADNWTPVTAVADGIVQNAIYGNLTSGSGYYVEIDHGVGVITRYLHNCQLNVSAGQQVKEGDVIALSGNTGNVRSDFLDINNPNFTRCSSINAGSHLHFEIIIGGNAVDPAIYGGWELAK